MPPKIDKIEPKFVTGFMPERDEMEPGILYISKQYGTAIHLCCCGCGLETVTSLTTIFKDGWTLTEDGPLVSLSPSIGNFQFPCRSHYFIEKNIVRWC